jgi:hypothetical protein
MVGVTPDRGWTEGIFDHPDGTSVAVLVTHFISGVRGDGKDPVERRRKCWRKHMAMLRARVLELRELADHVIVMGDFNQIAKWVGIPGMRRLKGSGLIDHILVSPGLHSLGVIALADRGSDHRPRVATLTTRPVVPDPPKPKPPKPTPPEVIVDKVAAKVIAIAKEQVGYHEGRKDGHWNNQQKFSPAVPGLEWSQGQAWCATFVSWVAMRAGAEKLFPRTASCDQARAWWKGRDRWSEYPCIGGQVIFGVPEDANHTGIVTAFDDRYVWTVEGNTNATGSREGDGVYVKQHERRSARILGYGYPDYPEGVITADPDPKWKRKVVDPAMKPANVRAAELVKMILTEKDVQRDDVAALLLGAVRDLQANKVKPA